MITLLDKQGREIQEQDKIMERIEEFYSELFDSDQAVTIQTDPKVTYAPQNRPSKIGNRQLGFKQSSTTTKLENRVPHKSTCHCDEVVELIMSRLAVGY